MSKRTIALIDGDVLVYRCAFAVERNIQWGDGLHTLHADEGDAKQAVDHLLQQILTDLNTEEYYLALTCHDTKNFRKEFYPEYKENRTTLRKPLVWKYLRDYLTSEYKAQVRPNLEADDILGIWATKVWPGKPKRVIVSIDKDFKSVPCHLFSFLKKEHFVIKEAEADFNFLMQVLTGDKTDNYPGCKGIGPKKAEAILNTAKEKAADWEEFAAMWAAVLKTYARLGFDATFVLTQARCARILRSCDYNFTTKQPILWEPPE